METVRASQLAFDRSSITVPVGSLLTLVFINEDAGVGHNLSVSINGTASETCTGPCQTSQTFIVSSPGQQVYFCNIHPGMFGFLNIE